jgi:hypothetical protein
VSTLFQVHREPGLREKGYDFPTYFFLTPPDNLSIVQAPNKTAIDALLVNPSTSFIVAHRSRERKDSELFCVRFSPCWVNDSEYHEKG